MAGNCNEFLYSIQAVKVTASYRWEEAYKVILRHTYVETAGNGY
jgi:hypothetical protein